MILTSIYGHFRRLHLPTDVQAMCRVGEIVRDLYLAHYGVKPAKEKRKIHGREMWVLVYPEAFAGQVVEAIRAYQACPSLPQVNTPAAQAPAGGAKRERIRIKPMQPVYSTAKTGAGKRCVSNREKPASA